MDGRLPGVGYTVDIKLRFQVPFPKSVFFVTDQYGRSATS